MKEGRKQGTWIQCQKCGHIYCIEARVSTDKLYVLSECPKCGHHKGLNCGDNKDDLYLYYNPVLDERYY